MTDGAHTANIALLGKYLASTFVASSDGHGGTSVSDPPGLGANPLVARPHVLARPDLVLIKRERGITRVGIGRPGVDKPDHRHRRRLGARPEWPSDRRAEQRDELASLQPIEWHRQPQPIPGQHIASARIKSGACCGAGFRSTLRQLRVKSPHYRTATSTAGSPQLADIPASRCRVNDRTAGIP